jgi:acetoacetyl-CoA synthetase
MFPVPSFFPDVRMNFAEHIMAGKPRSDIAMYACTEGAHDLRSYTWGELQDSVERIADALLAAGIEKGDRVGAIISHCAEAIMTCLAVLSIGAVWTTSSPDMGLKGIMDRLLQIQPKIVFFESSVAYNGKTRDLAPKFMECIKQLETLETFQFAVFIQRQLPVSVENKSQVRLWPDFLACGTGRELTFAQLPFNHPGFIVYSSGTVSTGTHDTPIRSPELTFRESRLEHQSVLCTAPAYVPCFFRIPFLLS